MPRSPWRNASAGTEETFAQLMNTNAKRLGMAGTHFENSSGLPSPNHYTTARDMSLLAIAMIRDFPQYYKWYSVREFEHNGIKQQNRNGLLERDSTVDGLKTGHTDSAGYCLVTSALRDGMRLVSVVLGSTSMKGRENASAALLNYGYHVLRHQVGGQGRHDARHGAGLEGGRHADRCERQRRSVRDGAARRGGTTSRRHSTLQPRLIAPLARDADIGQLRVIAGTQTLATLPATPLDERRGRRLVAAADRHRAAVVCLSMPLPDLLFERRVPALARGAGLAARSRVPVRRCGLRGRAGVRRAAVPAARASGPAARSLAGIRMPPPLSHPEWSELCSRAHRAQRRRRPISLYSGDSRRRIRPQSRVAGRAQADAVRLSRPRWRPRLAQMLEQGVSAVTAPDTRWARRDIKSTALLANILLKKLAVDAGAFETILLEHGELTEGSSTTVHVIARGVIHTPPNGHRILPGTTRDVVRELAIRLGIGSDSVSASANRSCAPPMRYGSRSRPAASCP